LSQATSILELVFRDLIFLVVAIAFCAAPARAQDNYEIQVYGADTVPPRNTMVELHSNFTVDGSKSTTDGTLPTNHAVHETIEITQGINSWLETGFYIFTSARNGNGWQWVGDHIRPRVRAPESWHWPVGVSVSNEIGYQRAIFSANTWTWELRPIVDKKIGPWYLAFNPVLGKSLHGPDESRGFNFSPNFKVSYDFTKKVSGGLEYYGSTGPITGFDPFRDQQQQFVPAIDLNVSPRWEFNFGLGVGVTQATDHLIIKAIVGRRFGKTNP
jgi:hypothetical protein